MENTKRKYEMTQHRDNSARCARKMLLVECCVRVQSLRVRTPHGYKGEGEENPVNGWGTAPEYGKKNGFFTWHPPRRHTRAQSDLSTTWPMDRSDDDPSTCLDHAPAYTIMWSIENLRDDILLRSSDVLKRSHVSDILNVKLSYSLLHCVPNLIC